MKPLPKLRVAILAFAALVLMSSGSSAEDSGDAQHSAASGTGTGKHGAKTPQNRAAKISGRQPHEQMPNKPESTPGTQQLKLPANATEARTNRRARIMSNIEKKQDSTGEAIVQNLK